MTIDEAIKTLTEILDDEESMWEPDGANALQLGIESLKRVNVRRDHLSWKFEPLLPGETE